MNAEGYSIKSPNIITVCYDCHPGESIFSIHPELVGNRISHGLCPRHFAIRIAEVDALRQSRSTDNIGTEPAHK